MQHATVDLARARAQRTARRIIYVGTLTSSTSSILLYTERRGHVQLTGAITQGVAQPFGLALDRHGNLYSANLASGTVTVYAPGTTTPSKTLNGAGHPDAVAIAHDGTVYVDDCGYCLAPHHRSTVLVYANGSTAPTSTFYRFEEPVYNTGIAVDRAGNVFVAYALVDSPPSQPRGAIIEFARGSKKGRDLGITLGSTGGLIVDRNDELIVADQGRGSLYPAAIDVFPPGTNKPSAQIPVYAYGLALDARNATLWVTGALNGYVAALSYPQGNVLDQFSPSGVAVGVAVGPG